MLIAARVVQGVGAALLLPGTLAIISRAFPRPGEQARAIGIWAGVGSVALPAGPLLGGVLVQSLGWRAVFWLNVPIVVLAAAAAARVVRESRGSRPRRLDRAGVGLGALLLAAGTFAVIQSGHGGLDVAVVVSVVVATAALVGFLAVERRAPEPMLPLELFRRPAFSAANGAAGAMNLGTLGLLFLLTLFLQTVQQRSALAAGVALLPLFLPLAVLAPLAGRATARLGPKLPMARRPAPRRGRGGSVDAAVPRLAVSDVATRAHGLGNRLGRAHPAVVAAVAAVAPDRAGLASGVNNTARQAGGAIGIAAFGALAGPPTDPAGFTTGIHVTELARSQVQHSTAGRGGDERQRGAVVTALATAALFAVAAIATVVLIPATQRR